jgi:hypothetical protein
MGSSAKRKTTMAKLSRESKLRERRVSKQAKKAARRQGHADHGTPSTAETAAASEPGAEQGRLEASRERP